MLITKHLLFNFSILFGILFVFHLWSDRFDKQNSKVSWFIVLFISVLACFLFSLPQQDVFLYDLRVIPVVIAGLYLGMGWFFVAMTLYLRTIIGLDMGLYTVTVVYIFLALALHFLHPWFMKQNAIRKNLSAMALVLATNSSLETLRHQVSDTSWAISIPFLFIPTIGVGVFIYALEYISRTDHLKRELIEAKRMDALEHLGAAISHEVRNPLTAARGFVQLVQENKELPEEIKHYLFIATEELNQAEKVIQDYLTFAKPSLEEVVELDVIKELGYVINTVLPLANQYSVSIKKDFSLVPSIRGDRAKFRQCLFNVMKNGIEAMHNGGTLTIITITDVKQTKILISDTGIGMSEEQIGRIGQPYYSTKGGAGTGLGMMTVQSIVKAMKGRLEMTSAVGVGTTMSFAFPSVLPKNQTLQISSSLKKSGVPPRNSYFYK